MSTMKFTTDHEWLRFEDDKRVTVGITDYAQDQLGDIVYVELPEVGTQFNVGDQIMVIESVKAVGEINAPLNGAITAVNERLVDQPEIVNSDPLADGWLFTFEPQGDVSADALLDPEAYDALVAAL